MVILLLLVLCVGTYFMFQAKPSGFIPSEDDGNLYVTLPAAAGIIYRCISRCDDPFNESNWFNTRCGALCCLIRD